jgi:hypothetical protein
LYFGSRVAKYNTLNPRKNGFRSHHWHMEENIVKVMRIQNGCAQVVKWQNTISWTQGKMGSNPTTGTQKIRIAMITGSQNYCALAVDWQNTILLTQGKMGSNTTTGTKKSIIPVVTSSQNGCALVAKW